MEEERTSIPRLTDEQVEEASDMGVPGSSSGEVLRTCPECGEEALAPRNDMVWEEARGHTLLVLRRLSGERCRECGERWFDPASYELVERHRRARPAANYEAKVTRVGGTSLGIYFPKDLRRVMGLEAGLMARITPVSETAAIIEFTRGAASEEAKDSGEGTTTASG